MCFCGRWEEFFRIGKDGLNLSLVLFVWILLEAVVLVTFFVVFLFFLNSVNIICFFLGFCMEVGSVVSGFVAEYGFFFD